MGPFGVVGLGPAGHGLAGMVDAEEQCLVQEFIPHPAVEGFAVPVLHGLPGGDVVPLHLHLLCPFQDRVRGELGAIIANDHAGLSTPFDQGCEFPGNPSA